MYIGVLPLANRWLKDFFVTSVTAGCQKFVIEDGGSGGVFGSISKVTTFK